MPRKSAESPLAGTRTRERLGKTQANSRLGERGRCRLLTRLLRCRCTGDDDPVDGTSPPSPPSVPASAKARVADAEGGLTGGATAAEAAGAVRRHAEKRAAGTTAAPGGADAGEDREGDRRVPTRPESGGGGGARAEWRKRAASFSGSLTLSPQPGGRGGLGRRKKKLAALASLPNVETRRMEVSVSSEEEMAGIENLACGAGGDDGETVAAAGGGLSMPTINFIPASPSDVLEDDQFFEINSEEEEERAASPPPSSDSDCVDSSGSHATVERENATGNAGDAKNSEASLALPATDTAKEFQGAVAREGAEETAEEAEVPGGDRHGLVDAVEDATAAATAATKKRKSFRLNSEITNAQLNAFPQTHPRKGSFNEGINLLQFTEQNIDELNTKECDMRDRLVQEMQKLHLQSDSLNKTAAVGGVEGSSSSRRRRKALEEMESDGACAWLQAMGMERLGIVVRGERLAGRHLASMDPETLESLRLRSWAERERLLSALYSETHSREARAVDSLLQSLSGADLQTFTAAIAGLGQPGERPGERPAEEERPRRSRHPSQGDRVSDLRGDLARIRAAIAQKEEDIARLPMLPPETDSLQVEEREMWLLQGEMELLDLKKELLGVRSALQLRRIAEAALSAGSRSHVTASCLEREWAAASRAGETITVTL
ncbi:uncharacterized protein LOC116948253 [Petromyzon marinus]|uniref:Uncharacterized protein LOC116948253 n=1 Tax=Petromyzon marinus TaxID=7757 RepID=A0AAJ7X5C2_PETMA|nr:uncharacterized protein LOC116948253 [Petromyzon marinus]